MEWHDCHAGSIASHEGIHHVFVAASTVCFADKSFEDACQLLADLEFDKLELWLHEGSPQIQPAEVAADPEAFALHYRETTRITPAAICLADDIAADQFAGISRAAKLLHVTQVTVPAAPLGTPFNSEIERLRELLGVASRDGIRLSIKTETGRLTEDPDTAVELCGSVKGLGLTLDPSHYLAGSRRVESFERLAPHVYHVHLRDSSSDSLQVKVGLGEIDYSRLIMQLRSVGYSRALSVELIPSLTDSETRPLEMRKLRMLLDSLL